MSGLYRKSGVVLYWLLWPLIYIYTFVSKPRARVIIVCGNQVLLVRNWLGPGNWALPGGGLERGEQAAEAASREIQEELGIQTGPEQFEMHGQHTFKGKGGMLVKYYLCSLKLPAKPALTLKTNEIMDSRWTELDSITNGQVAVSRSVTAAIQVWNKGQNLV